jgi:hypothetical protein
MNLKMSEYASISSKTFTTPMQLQKHQLHDCEYSGQGRPICECGTKLADRDSLRRHKREACILRLNPLIEGVECTQCHEWAATSAILGKNHHCDLQDDDEDQESAETDDEG